MPMMRLLSLSAACAVAAYMALPVQAARAEPGLARAAAPQDVSSRQRTAKQVRVRRMHYYDPYPWWWYPPYGQRVRTNYLGWPHTSYPPGYERPHFDGVAGFPLGRGS
jgi:hypothetical protein